VILDRLDVDPAAFEARTGWAIKPEGACRGDVCVPLPDGVRNGDGTLDAPALQLPDADGNPFDLASLHGQKVLLVAWASW
jgi:hypothetical protein